MILDYVDEASVSQFVWTENTKPDRPGIWANRHLTCPVYVHKPEMHDVGTWCYLMPLPTIADPPRYREVRKGDEGEVIEVAGYCGQARFIGFSTRGELVYEQEDGRVHISKPKLCRILDTEPAKKAREPREVWINEYRGGLGGTFYSDWKHAQANAGSGLRKTIRFVEDIIEPAC